VKKMQWKLLPSAIVDTLKRNGALKFEELFKNTKKRFSGISENDLEDMLMKMEIQGLVKVYRLPRGKKRIELA
jgi:DNA-binding HxlR family transcriptional regulator